MAEQNICLKKITATFSVENPNNLSEDVVTDEILDAIAGIEIDTGSLKIKNQAVFFSMNNLEVTEKDK